MTAPDPSRQLTDLLDGLAIPPGPSDPHTLATPEPPPGRADPVLAQLLFSILLCDTAYAQAQAAMARLRDEVVDCNELRVCTRSELESMLGSRFPRSAERADRLKAALNDIYLREHALSLDHLTESTKRQARIYIESIEGVPPFAAARTLLLELAVHAFPIDSRITALLKDHRVVPAGLAPQTVATKIERLIRAGQARDAYLRIEHWCQHNAQRPRKAPRAKTKTSPSAAPKTGNK